MADFSWLIDPVYIVTIFFFIVGMQRMSHPLTARSGIVWAGAAMLIATLVTFFSPNLSNLALIALAIVIGGGFGYIAAKRVAMTDMPQMIARPLALASRIAATTARNDSAARMLGSESSSAATLRASSSVSGFAKSRTVTLLGLS